jgi:hypothetical protein
MVQALEALVQQRDQFDCILIETTGDRQVPRPRRHVGFSRPPPLSRLSCPNASRPAGPCHVHAGLANPGPVAAALWTDEQMESLVCLDAIVTVVDARNIVGQLGEARPVGSVNEAQQQVAYADVILINKVRGLGWGEILTIG